MADPSAPPAEPDLGILLTLALRGFVDLLHAGLDERGFGDVRPPFGVVFRALRDGPLTLTELARQLDVTKQAAAKVVDEMVRKALVEREDSTVDGRAKLLRLTQRGRHAMATAIARGAELEALLRGEAGEEAVDSTRRTLAAFVRLAGGGEDLALRRSRAIW